MKRLSLLAALLVTQAGCFIYFDNGGGDDDCNDEFEDRPVGDSLRNPFTGQCEFVGGGGGGGGGCDDGGGDFMPQPLPEPTNPDGTSSGGGGTGSDSAGALEAPAWNPDWAVCNGFCEGLDEASCQATDACRAIYVESCPECDDISPPVFAACWGTAPTGPIKGDCTGLDAQSCSMHDDCVAVHDDFLPDCGTMGKLTGARCSIAENTPGDFLWCAPEPAIEDGCWGDSDCAPGYECTSDTECLNPPGCDPATGMACPPVCYGRCVPVMPVTCGEIADEATCIAQGDCRPLYQGSDCSCGPMGCFCSTQTFIACGDGMGGGEGTSCGPYMCSGAEYCEHGIGGAAPPPGQPPFESWACRPLPDTCLSGMWGSFCECLKSEPCGQICSIDAAGQATLTCAYP